MGWYRVVKTIKGHRYIYDQRTWRDGQHVRTESRYVGPAGDERPPARSSGEPDQANSGRTRPAASTSAVNTTRQYRPELVEQTFASLTEPPRGAPLWQHAWRRGRKKPSLVQRNAEVDGLIKALQVKQTHRFGGAYYEPVDDRVNVPPEWSYVDLEKESATSGYYATQLHELAHWTGHSTRLHRLPKNAGAWSRDYAQEELVAEATCLMLLNHFGLTPESSARHAVYFQHWLDRAGNKEEALAYAKREAERAARFILGVNTTSTG